MNGLLEYLFRLNFLLVEIQCTVECLSSQVECTVGGTPLQPLIGSNVPTSSPTLIPSITNVVPIGSHTVVTGSGMPPGETTPGFFGGRRKLI